MLYKTILSINDRESLFNNFDKEFSKFKKEYDLALLCNLKNPIEENDKEAIFYVYGSKSEECKEFLEKYGFKIIHNLPENLKHILGYYKGVWKRLEKNKKKNNLF